MFVVRSATNNNILGEYPSIINYDDTSIILPAGAAKHVVNFFEKIIVDNTSPYGYGGANTETTGTLRNPKILRCDRCNVDLINNITCPNQVVHDQEDVDWAIEAHVAWPAIRQGNDIPSNITGNLLLATTNTFGVTITWATSNATAVTTTGIVGSLNWKDGDRLANITATVKKGTVIETIVHELRVPAPDMPWESAGKFGSSFFKVCYGNGMYVAVGDDEIWSSFDSRSWTKRDADGMNLQSIAFANGTFVAVGNGRTNPDEDYPRFDSNDSRSSFIRISTDGINWEDRTTELWYDDSYSSAADKTTKLSAAEGQYALPFADVTHGAGLFVAIVPISGRYLPSGTGAVMYADRYGTIATSQDGRIWRRRRGPSVGTTVATYYNPALWRIIGKDNLIVATRKEIQECINNTWKANTAQVMTATDADGTWTYRTSGLIDGAQRPFHELAWNGSKYVGICGGSMAKRVCSSTNGTTWTYSDLTDPRQFVLRWESICYGDGLFVAVAAGGGNGTEPRIMTSTDGLSWTSRPSIDDTKSWVSVIYGNGKFVATASDGTIMTFTEGKAKSDADCAYDDADWITWDRIKNANDYMDNVKTALSLVTAGAPNGSTITWASGTTATISTAGVVNRPAWTAGDAMVKLTATIKKGTTTVTRVFKVTAKSFVAPGSVWETMAAPGGSTAIRVAFINGHFWLHASDKNWKSDDGKNWTEIPTNIIITRIAFGGGKYVGYGYTTRRLYYSTDCVNWTESDIGSVQFINDLVYWKDKFIFVRDSATTGWQLGYSTNGENWTEVILSSTQATNPSSNTFFCWLNTTTLTLILGHNTNAYSSTNGIAWTARTVPDCQWRSGTYGANPIAITGKGNANDLQVATSTNGTTFTKRTDTANWYPWPCVAFGGGGYVALSTGSFTNMAMYSSNGTAWTMVATPVEMRVNFGSIVFGNGVFVGAGGSILAISSTL